jgi:hypothetical protein
MTTPAETTRNTSGEPTSKHRYRSRLKSPWQAGLGSTPDATTRPLRRGTIIRGQDRVAADAIVSRLRVRTVFEASGLVGRAGWRTGTAPAIIMWVSSP